MPCRLFVEPSDFPQPSLSSLSDELELLTSQAESKVCAKHSLPGGMFWGPFPGNIHSEPPSPGLTELVSFPQIGQLT